MCIGYAFKAKFFNYLILSIVIFISGFRYLVGYDYLNYYTIFVGNSINSIELEPLFMLISEFSRRLWNNPQYTFLIFSTITISVVFFTIPRYTKYHRTAFLFYLLIPGLYLNSFSIVRQGVAISFFFLSIYYLIYVKNIWKFFIYSLVGFLLHFSMIIPTILVYFLRNQLVKKYSTSVHIYSIIIALMLSFSGILSTIISTFGGRYSIYGTLVDEVSFLKVVILSLFSLFIVYSYRKINDNRLVFLLNLNQLGILISIAFSDFAPITRLAYYFTIFQIILVAELIYRYKTQGLKILALVLFVSYYFGLQINALLTDEKVEYFPKMTPYTNYFMADKTW